MKKNACLIIFLLLIFSCDDKEPATPSCGADLTVLGTKATVVHAGDELVIEGKNICPEEIQSVTMNGVTASVKSATATTITVIVPAMDAGSAQIKVTFNGFDIVLEDAVTVAAMITPCDPKATVLRAGTTHSYTGGEWTIAGEQICTDAVQAVTINGINATIKTKSETAIVIEVPAMKPGAVDVKISYNGGEIVLGDKVKVYPGNGTWKEVSPFPQTGKMESRTFVTGGKAYVLSGSQVTKPAGEYAFTYFNNIYEYDPMADTWTFKLEDESLDEIWYLASCRLGSRYVYTSVRETEMKAYDPVSNSLSSIGYPDLHNPQVGLAINDNAYVLTEDDAAYALELYKYDQGKDTWPLVNSTKPNYASTNYFLPWAPFAHEGYGYFTTAQINVDKEIWLWRFDPKDNSITKISSVGTSREAGVEFPGLEYLFTIDGLAYFIEMGSFDLDPSSIIEPSKTLYIYNFEWNEWHVVDNALPQTFYRPASFTVDNRGFLGLGLGKGPGPSYAYPNNFYEFLPE